MTDRDKFVLGLLLVLLMSLLISVSHAATSLLEQTQEKITNEFNSRYKDNTYNPAFTKIVTRYEQRKDIYMASVYCDKKRNEVVVTFDEALVLSAQVDKYAIATTLAHELGHCYSGSNDNYEKEYLADAYGLKLFKESGGTLKQYLTTFEADVAASATHPSNRERLNKLLGGHNE